MEKYKKILIMIMVLVICIILVVISLLLLHKKQDIKEDNPSTLAFEDTEKLTNRALFFQIDDLIGRYIKAGIINNEKELNAIAPQGNFPIDPNQKNMIFLANEMYVIDKINNITVFVEEIGKEQVTKQEYYFVVHMDYTNQTYEIIVSTKQEFEQAKNNQIRQEYKQDISIKQNEYNKLKQNTISDLQILKKYFDDYKFKAINRPEEAFALLEVEYRKVKFHNDVNEFVQYVKSNLETLQDANIVKHGITKEGSVTKYSFVDQYDHYYELRETGIYEYTMVLDNYTVASDEQKQEYERLPEEQKAVSNMDKVMKLINEKDYSTVYGYLNTEFKNTNFPTIETFTTYMQANFFENNIVGKIGIRKEGNIYLLKVPYKESLSSVAEEGEKTFMMKLGEGTNFEISFEI